LCKIEAIMELLLLLDYCTLSLGVCRKKFRDHVVTPSYRVNGTMQKIRRTFCSVFCIETQYIHSFLGAFEKLQKVTISFVMSVRPHRTIRLSLDGFSQNFIS